MFINGKNYQLPEIGHGTIRKLKRMGVDLMAGQEIDPLETVSGIVALAMGCGIDRADKEIDLHINNGHDYLALLEEAGQEFNNALVASNFFKALVRKEQLVQEAKTHQENLKKSILEEPSTK